MVRTAWLPEERPPGDYVYRGWINVCPAGQQSYAEILRMGVGGWPAACRTQGEAACKIEIRAFDMAGNESDLDREFFNIDWTAPRIEIEEAL